MTNTKTIQHNLSCSRIEILTEDNKTYNFSVNIPGQMIYCKNQLSAINLLKDLSEVIAKAQD